VDRSLELELLFADRLRQPARPAGWEPEPASDLAAATEQHQVGGQHDQRPEQRREDPQHAEHRQQRQPSHPQRDGAVHQDHAPVQCDRARDERGETE